MATRFQATPSVENCSQHYTTLTLEHHVFVLVFNFFHGSEDFKEDLHFELPPFIQPFTVIRSGASIDMAMV
jgi:hypothetical protein